RVQVQYIADQDDGAGIVRRLPVPGVPRAELVPAVPEPGRGERPGDRERDQPKLRHLAERSEHDPAVPAEHPDPQRYLGPGEESVSLSKRSTRQDTGATVARRSLRLFGAPRTGYALIDEARALAAVARALAAGAGALPRARARPRRRAVPLLV